MIIWSLEVQCSDVNNSGVELFSTYNQALEQFKAFYRNDKESVFADAREDSWVDDWNNGEGDPEHQSERLPCYSYETEDGDLIQVRLVEREVRLPTGGNI